MSSKMQDVVFPWPWTLHQSEDYPRPSFWILAANRQEVVRYHGPDAAAKAEVIMNLAAGHAVRNRSVTEPSLKSAPRQ